MKKECPECESGMVEAHCGHCNGSGEGMYDGSRCRICKGSGDAAYECEKCGGSGEVEIECPECGRSVEVDGEICAGCVQRAMMEGKDEPV